ncbi:unnamed protein product, partial [Amoebophrya sp. A120]
QIADLEENQERLCEELLFWLYKAAQQHGTNRISGQEPEVLTCFSLIRTVHTDDADHRAFLQRYVSEGSKDKIANVRVTLGSSDQDYDNYRRVYNRYAHRVIISQMEVDQNKKPYAGKLLREKLVPVERSARGDWIYDFTIPFSELEGPSCKGVYVLLVGNCHLPDQAAWWYYKAPKFQKGFQRPFWGSSEVRFSRQDRDDAVEYTFLPSAETKFVGFNPECSCLEQCLDELGDATRSYSAEKGARSAIERHLGHIQSEIKTKESEERKPADPTTEYDRDVQDYEKGDVAKAMEKYRKDLKKLHRMLAAQG